MRRVIASTPWLLAAAAIGLATLVALLGEAVDPFWRIAVSIAGLTAGIVGWRLNRLPPVFTVGFTLSGLQISGTNLPDRVVAPESLSWLQAGSDVIVGLLLIVLLIVILKSRRGEINRRDMVDGLTITIGTSLTAWVLFANPLVDRFSVQPALAVTAVAYLPIAVLLMTFTTELFLTGLVRNRGMRFIMIAVVVNLVTTVLVDLDLSRRITSDVGALSVGLYIGGFLFLCASVSHRDLPDVMQLIDESQRDDPKTALRLTLMACCLIVPVVSSAAVAPTSSTDIAVRTIGTAALVIATIARLFMALNANDQAEHELVRRLSRDEVTNLPTRRLLTEFAGKTLESTWHSEQQPTLIQINLDRFKNLSDSLGSSESDAAVIVVAERLSAAALTFDGFVARSAGDDFVVIDTTTTSPTEAMTRAELIRDVISAPIPVGERSVFVTASIGVAVAPRNRTVTAEEFMRRANIATHHAKVDGRNRVAVFDDSMQADLARRMDVEHALHGAIGRQEMRLYHQPIVNVTTGKVNGFEALMRWRRVGGSLVPPNDFIPIAEETGIICELGAWALLQGLNDLRGWIDDGVIAPTATMSVNVSPRQIADADFADVVRHALDCSGVQPHLLWLEVTESMMLQEPELALATLRQIQAMGVRLALDDFGTGYSSLSMLQEFPIQRIKIDRAFVRGIADSGHDRSLVRTIIAMAQSMGFDMVAEGVETVHQLHSLRELGCDKAQGYLISHPVPGDAMRTTMSALNELSSLSLFGPIESRSVLDDSTDRILEPVGASTGAPFRLGLSRPLGQVVI